jgi:hypothetical protein
MPLSRRGTWSRSIRAPELPFEAASATALVPHHRRVLDELLERLDQALLEEGVADLDRRAPLLRAAVQLERCERRAMDAVAAGVGADQ